MVSDLWPQLGWLEPFDYKVRFFQNLYRLSLFFKIAGNLLRSGSHPTSHPRARTRAFTVLSSLNLNTKNRLNQIVQGGKRRQIPPPLHHKGKPVDSQGKQSEQYPLPTS
jgi:hypothetical protein